MKKILLICVMAIAAGSMLVSCQESAEKKDRAVAYKIENNEALTTDDYARIISYVGEYAEKAQKYVDMQINGENVAEAQAGMDRLKAEYPLVDEFRNCLRVTPVANLSEENLQEIGKYAGYIEFSAPAGYDIQTLPGEAGLEEAAPAEENGVVAGSVDTLEIQER